MKASVQSKAIENLAKVFTHGILGIFSPNFANFSLLHNFKKSKVTMVRKLVTSIFLTSYTIHCRWLFLENVSLLE